MIDPNLTAFLNISQVPRLCWDPPVNYGSSVSIKQKGGEEENDKYAGVTKLTENFQVR